MHLAFSTLTKGIKMSLESEMKKVNGNLERLSTAIESLVTGKKPVPSQETPPQPATSFNPVTETKVVEAEVKKESTRTVAEVVDELLDDGDEIERAPLTAKQVQDFAREKMKDGFGKKKDPKLRIEIKKKITDLGASKITELDQDGLYELEKFLRNL